MRILILTSKDHPYATMLINRLLTANIFSGCEVHILEQDALLPRHSAIQALWKYYHSAGFTYVFAQIFKQKLFLLRRYIAWLTGDICSLFYPYMKRKDVCLRLSPFTTILSSSSQSWIQKLQPELILSLLSKEIIPKNLLTLPSLGALNLHPALLPAYRGVSPTFWALAEGETKAGVTLHRVDEGIDTGAYIAQQSFSIDQRTTEHAVYVQAVKLGAALLIDALSCLKSGASLMSVLPISGVVSSYRSLPTRAAVRALYSRGHGFFCWSEFWSKEDSLN